MSDKAYKLSEDILSSHDSAVSASVVQPEPDEPYFAVVVNTDNGYTLESTLTSRTDYEDLISAIGHVAHLPPQSEIAVRSNTKEGFPE